MTDLLIFHQRPELVEPFIATPERMPRAFVDERAAQWKGDFEPTRREFVDAFESLLNEQSLSDLERLGVLRNAIAHCRVSIARDYFLYRPRSNRERRVLEVLGLTPGEDAADPPTLALRFFDDADYFFDFAVVKGTVSLTVFPAVLISRFLLPASGQRR